MKRERALLLVNPKAGKQGARRYFYTIVSGLSKKYTLTVHLTDSAQDATVVASQAKDFDTVICCGGDGTISQFLNGYPLEEKCPTLGYIPTGTTNDFATSMQYSKNIPQAVRDVVNGSVMPIDIASFNERKFVYIASFGAFTRTSYNTPQELKHVMGHFAYVIGGYVEVANIKAEPVTVVCDGEKHYFDDACFLAAFNSTSVAGLLKFDSDEVDLADGKHEIMVIRRPKNIQRLSELVNSLALNDYADDPSITMLRGERFEIITEKKVPWTLDGEDAGEFSTVVIKNMHHAVNFICPPSDKKS